MLVLGQQLLIGLLRLSSKGSEVGLSFEKIYCSWSNVGKTLNFSVASSTSSFQVLELDKDRSCHVPFVLLWHSYFISIASV